MIPLRAASDASQDPGSGESASENQNQELDALSKAQSLYKQSVRSNTACEASVIFQ